VYSGGYALKSETSTGTQSYLTTSQVKVTNVSSSTNSYLSQTLRYVGSFNQGTKLRIVPASTSGSSDLSMNIYYLPDNVSYRVVPSFTVKLLHAT